ncbi:1196_t:CDS:2, partial [Acaulospora morrowiae]
GIKQTVVPVTNLQKKKEAYGISSSGTDGKSSQTVILLLAPIAKSNCFPPNSTAFGFNQAFTQPTGYNSAVVFSSTAVSPPQAISPNPLDSLLNTLNTQIASPTPTLPIGVTQIQSPLNSQNGESDNGMSLGTDEQAKGIENSIKSLLFGHASPAPNIDD